MTDQSASMVIRCSDGSRCLKILHHFSSQPLTLAGQGVEKAAVLHDNISSTIEKTRVDPMIAVDGSIRYANEINKLKRGLERERKTNETMQSTGQLWKKKCSRLRKALNDAIVRAEEVISAPCKLFYALLQKMVMFH